MYPEFAQIDGKTYKLNTDYRIAKKCFGIINNPDICDEERALAVIYKLFGFVPHENGQAFLDKAVLFLRCGAEPTQSVQVKPDFDVNFDEGLIQASFQSCYGIDIDRVKMHWWKFNDLLQGLDKYCVLSRVREIRNYDLSEIKDVTQRQKMAEAQAALALPEIITPEEQKQIEWFDSLFD